MNCQEYEKEIKYILRKEGTPLELTQCLHKHFVDSPYYVEALSLQELYNNIMLSPLGNPNEEELIEARAIEQLILEMKGKLTHNPN